MADTALTLTGALVAGIRRRALPQNLVSPTSRTGYFPLVRDWYAGAWQRNDELRVDSVLAYHAVFACVTLISSDIGKLRPKLVEERDGIWSETESPAFSPVLRRPNSYQNHIQFKEWWITSKLVRGNAYALKQRDDRNITVALYLLDPCRVKPLISPSGLVFYELQPDNLSGVEESVIVPASEVLHDRMNCLYHPLVGLSPIYACGLAAQQGLAIQNNSQQFFGNMSRPSGILTAPGPISDEDARDVGAQWQANYSGANSGRVAVLGDDLKYQALSVTAEDAQLIEQLRMTAEIVCSCFHVPAFKIGMGPLPATASLEVLNGIYYSDCLQSLIENWEATMDDGLGLAQTETNGRMLGIELDLDQLLRMDSESMMRTLQTGVGAGIVSPNEARRRVDLAAVKGGETPYLQQQNFGLAALAERDADQPFAKPAPALPAPSPTDEAARALVMAVASRFAEPPLRETITLSPPPAIDDTVALLECIERGLADA